MLRTTRLALLLAGAGLAASTLPASAAAPVLRGPSAHGVVKLGDRVVAELTGRCGSARTLVRARVGQRTVDGPVASGCAPVVTVPSAAALSRVGWVEGDPLRLSVVSGASSVPLTYARLEPAGAAVVSGAPAVVAKVSDPLGGRTGLAMSTGDVIDLGAVDLTNLQSVDVRNLSTGTGTWELRLGSAKGTAVASGQLGMPGSPASTGDAGWYHSIGQLQFRTGQAVVGDLNTLNDLTPAVGQAPHVFLAMTAVLAPNPVVVNWVDVNGPGLALPHRFGPERGFETLFDGTSFDGWSHVGPGHFVLKDGAMRAEHDVQDRGWAWLWWTRAQYTDFDLRLRFRIENWEDNGGVLLRHVDPQGDPNRSTNSADEIQIQEGFENLTGGIAHSKDATRLATGMVGQWNDVEIVSVGPLYVVRINGLEVQRYRTTKALRGFLSVENEQIAGTHGGHLWYDDIRVHRCSAGDPVCR
jgi:hypothetical protein